MRLRFELGISLFESVNVPVLKKEKKNVRGVGEMSASTNKSKEFDEMKNIRYLMHFSVNLKRLICIITKVIGSRFIGLS